MRNRGRHRYSCALESTFLDLIPSPRLMVYFLRIDMYLKSCDLVHLMARGLKVYLDGANEMKQWVGLAPQPGIVWFSDDFTISTLTCINTNFGITLMVWGGPGASPIGVKQHFLPANCQSPQARFPYRTCLLWAARFLSVRAHELPTHGGHS